MVLSGTVIALSSYIDLFVCPAIHAERFDLGDVGAELPVDGSTSHAEENA